MHKEKLSYQETARLFEINTHDAVAKRERIHLEEGPKGLYIERRGKKFIDVANSILERKNLPTKLQTVRKAVNLTQDELSEKSGVTSRMIQQYEQRARDINK